MQALGCNHTCPTQHMQALGLSVVVTRNKGTQALHQLFRSPGKGSRGEKAKGWGRDGPGETGAGRRPLEKWPRHCCKAFTAAALQPLAPDSSESPDGHPIGNRHFPLNRGHGNRGRGDLDKISLPAQNTCSSWHCPVCWPISLKNSNC